LLSIGEGVSQIASQLTAFAKGPQWEKSGIAGGFVRRTKGEKQLWPSVTLRMGVLGSSIF
jgi:hypothetical protein